MFSGQFSTEVNFIADNMMTQCRRVGVDDLQTEGWCVSLANSPQGFCRATTTPGSRISISGSNEQFQAIYIRLGILNMENLRAICEYNWSQST